MCTLTLSASQCTGEANMKRAHELFGDTLDDFVSAPKMVLHKYICDGLLKPGSWVERLNSQARRKLQVQVGSHGCRTAVWLCSCIQ